MTTLFVLQLPVKAQYHLRNGDMSNWVSVGATAEHAQYWNSMKNGATGSYNTTPGKCVFQSTDVPPVPGITYSAQLKCVEITVVIFKIKQNGQMTTGRVSANSATATDANGNYNYTDVSNSEYSTPIMGKPDSIRFWAKCVNSSLADSARMNAVIHDDYNYHDPEGTGGSASHRLGNATLNFNRVGANGTWIEYKLPFVYNGPSTSSPANILVTFTTNKTAGQGTVGDALYVTDVELIYSSWLSDLKVNGTTIAGFEKDVLDYPGPALTGASPYAFPYDEGDILPVLETHNPNANAVVRNVTGENGDADGGYTSILVTAEDGTSKEYKIHYASGSSYDNTIASLGYTLDGLTSIPVPGFSSTVSNTAITLTDPEEVRIPQIRAEDIVLNDPNATIYSINQPTSVNSVGSIRVRAQDYSLKTYTLTFSKSISTDSTLSWLKVGNVDIPNFDAETFEYNYNVTTCVTANGNIPTVTYSTSSPWATVKYTQAITTTKTATIEVTAENGAQATYTINFIFNSDDVSFTRFRFSGGNSYDITQVTGQTVYEKAFSFTSAQTITPTWTCGAATFDRTPASTVYCPDTNYFTVTAQDGITEQKYKIVLKNTNCYLATGNNNGIRYNYNGSTNQNSGVNITSTNNNNTNTITTSTVTIPVGPNVPPEVVVYGLAAGSIAPPTVNIVQPGNRNDTAIVTLTANDGITSKTYRIPFKATLSTDATLSNITYNGNQVMGFAPNIEDYTVTLPSNAASVPEIAVTPNFQYLAEENIIITPAISLLDTTRITVIAENGIATKTYSISYDVGDLYIQAIQYDNVTIPGFSSNVYSYTVDIPYSTTTPPQISAIPNLETATVLCSQPTTLPYQGKVYLLSESMTVIKMYTISFRLVKNTDTTLTDLQVNGISLQDFNPQTFSYDVELPYMELNIPVVEATTTHPFATVDVRQIDTIVGTAIVTVTAEDEDYTATYTVNFTRELSPVTSMDTVKYEYNNQHYTYAISNNGTEIAIPLPAETEGTPTITDIVLSDNRAEFTIDEQPGTTNVLTGTVTVTAEDLTERSYSITFERIESGNTLLTDISYNGSSIPDFHPDTTTYYVTLPFGTVQPFAITATADWKNTVVQIAQATQTSWQAQIQVTSEDGDNSISYTIHFIREGNVNIASLSYKLGATSIPVPNFDPQTLVYNVRLPIATTEIPFLEYVREDSRTQATQNVLSLPNGQIQLTFITFDYADTLTYTVNFEVELSTEALLSDLRINGVTVEGFHVDLLGYFIEHEYGTETLPVVTAHATQPDARIEYTHMSQYPGITIVKVYAGDTTISRTYTISFSMEAGDNNYLSGITIDGATLAGFRKDVHFYEVFLPYGTAELPVVTDAITEDQKAIMSITNILQFADTAKVEVTALNGDKRVYQLLFIIRKNNDAQAKSISINGEPLANFVPNTRNYNYKLPVDYSGIPFVTAELNDSNATYQIIPPAAIPGLIQVVVTAEDGESQYIYRINLTKETTSIVSFENKVEIKVYPNPSSDNIYFTINGLQTGSLEIYTFDSKLIGNHILQEGTNTINIANLPKGMYFYKVSTNREVIGTGKFIKN